MGDRAEDRRLTELREKGIEIYSISRLGSINNCLYEAYNTYVLHNRGDGNIYTYLGSRSHDVLEGIVNGENTEADLLPAINQELEDMELFGIEFPKDARGGDAIKDGWVQNMTHFANNYKSPRGNNLHTEELFIYKSPKGNYLQGYIDLYKENKDGTISIYDYKTSSMYKGEDLKEHGYQLVVYKLGLEQLGYKVKDVAWIFLKYVDVTFMGKKTAKSKEKSKIVKTVERRKIASEMAKYVEADLYELGYDEIDIEIMIGEFIRDNDFSVLPEKVANNYIITPCVLNYDVTDEVIEDCERYIDDTIEKWTSLKNEEDYKHRDFTKTQKNGKCVDDIFYCTCLCNHRKTCKYIKDYLDMKNNAIEDEDDLF